MHIGGCRACTKEDCRPTQQRTRRLVGTWVAAEAGAAVPAAIVRRLQAPAAAGRDGPPQRRHPQAAAAQRQPAHLLRACAIQTMLRQWAVTW
jgi:hypothetical protein